MEGNNRERGALEQPDTTKYDKMSINELAEVFEKLKLESEAVGLAIERKKLQGSVEEDEYEDHSGNSFGGSKNFPGPYGDQDGRE